MNFLKSLKKTYIWKFFIQNLFYPIYNIIWQYLINFNAKILYFIWFFKKREFIKFNRNDKILIKDNNTFKNISKKILKECLPLLENSRKKILSEEYKKKLSEKMGPTAVDAELPYRISMYENLSETLKKEILTFASSDFMISTAANYMGIFPILTRISVGHITSSYYSPNLGRSFALALVKSGLKKKGLKLYAPIPGKTVEVQITNPVFVDPKNERLKN